MRDYTVPLWSGVPDPLLYPGKGEGLAHQTSPNPRSEEPISNGYCLCMQWQQGGILILILILINNYLINTNTNYTVSTWGRGSAGP